MSEKERCIFSVEEQGSPLGGGSDKPCCCLSGYRLECDGLKDKENCPHWSKKSGGEK